MGKEKLTMTVNILTIISAVITLISAAYSFLIPMFLWYKLQLNTSKASSIGIIGGADGPTAIYLTNQPHSHLITIIFALLTIGGIAYLICSKKNN